MATPHSSTAVKNALADGVLQAGGLAVDATAEKFKTTATLYWRRNGIQFSKAATTAIAFSEAYTINTAAAAGVKYGVFLVQITDAGVFSTKAPASDQSYSTAALAIAALPAVDTGNTRVGYIVVGAPTGADWVAQTDDLTAASDVTSVSFVDETVVASLASL